MKDWSLLKDKEIIELIIGDKTIEDHFIYKLKMPYMTGKDIYEFSTILGLIQDYNLSRKDYMTNIIDFVISNNKINLFFKELFNLKRFRKIEQIPLFTSEQLYWEIIHKFFHSINEILYFDKCHLEYNMKTFEFSLIDDEQNIYLKTDEIKKVDREYIQKLEKQIDNVIKTQDYDSAITKSRTMIEEVLVLGIEKKEEIPTEKGNINNLYSQFKNLYNMHQDKKIDKRINDLLSGINKIVTAISEMRDKNSDSHGLGDKRINIEEHHAILFVNSAKTISNFLLAVIEKNNK